MLSQEKYATYLPAIRQLRQEEQRQGEILRAQAHKTARQIASILYVEFEAEHVLLFGSIIEPGTFDKHSQIELAVSGIPSDRFYRAVADVVYADNVFKVDLVDLDYCRTALRDVILGEGLRL